MSNPDHRSRAAIYRRVSSDEQHPENQLRSCIDHCRRRDYRIVWHHEESASAWSGKRRPVYDDLLARVKAGEIDVVVVWKADRITRSLDEAAELRQLFRRVDVRLDCVTQPTFNFDPADPISRAIAEFLETLLFAIAENESNVRSERVLAGIARARVNGTRSGNPIGRPPALTDPERAAVIARARSMKEAGATHARIMRDTGITRHCLRTYLR